jgi:hypothetical protein
MPGFGPLKARKLRYCLYYWGHRDYSGDVAREREAAEGAAP